VRYNARVTLSADELLRLIRALPRPERYRLAKTLVDDLSDPHLEPHPAAGDEDLHELQRAMARSRITQPLRGR
jgi:hypothetical protein